MTIIDIRNRYAEHRDEFRAVAAEVFAARGFSAEEARGLLAKAESEEIRRIYRVDVDGGRYAFVAAAGRWEYQRIELILPNRWADREAIARGAIRLLQRQPNVGTIWLKVSELPASHLTWVLELLPSLGFELDRKAGLALERDALPNVDVPPLPAGFALVEPKGRLAEIADCMAAAFAPVGPYWPPRGKVRDAAWWTPEIVVAGQGPPAVWAGWFHAAVEHEGRLVGFCEGAASAADVFVRNIGVVPEYWRRGLATNLLTRCAAALFDQTPQRSDPLVLSTHRDFQPGMAFYTRIGFRTIGLWTEATWHRAVEQDAAAGRERGER